MIEQTKHPKILGWLVTMLTPLVIIMISVRLLITPLFPQLEYRLPGFPDDPYGFSLEDRLRWSEPSINYLVNTHDISFLESLAFEEGDPIFNERELSHMEDVKSVVTGMRIALALATLFLLGITIIAIRNRWKKVLLKSFHRGGWAVIGLIISILFFVALSFNHLFTWFHQIFFESGTWQFYYSDTLIRLFPMRFWQDAFIFVGIISLLLGGILIYFSRNLNEDTQSIE